MQVIKKSEKIRDEYNFKLKTELILHWNEIMSENETYT